MEILNIDKVLKKFAEDTPNKIAIECGKTKVTYEKLHKRTDDIANFFMESYKATKNVCVIMERDTVLIEVLIGVIKSGGIFIPVEYNNPDEKIINILNEIKIDWIVTSPNFLQKVNSIVEKANFKVNILLMKSKKLTKCEKNSKVNIFSIEENIEKLLKPQEYCINKHCYIYFTSGSTGKPKAVLGRQKSLMQFIQWEIKEMGINKESRVSQLTPISFDPFLRDVFVPLCAGGTLCIPDNEEIIFNPIKLINWIDQFKITVIHSVPSLFKVISSEIESPEIFKSLKYILLAGEILRGNDIKKFMRTFGNRIQLVNLYGPTETTLAKVFYKIKEEDMNKSIIPVGKPIDFAQVFILNENLKKCAKGIIGDIYIRTPFITSGYCNDKELTAKVFMKNPFTDNLNDIIYKTGDLGKRLKDDNIEVIGRVDNQIKIRGMRIELGEIENLLLQYESIKEAVVIAKEDEFNNKYLCAYIVVSAKLNVCDVKKYLLTSVAKHMVPSYFIELESMPLNQNGKIDRKKLVLLDNTIETEKNYVPPTNEIEEKLADLWSNILNMKKISIDSNFFDLGGHSLNAAKLIAEIYREFNVEISFMDVFNKATIRKLSEYILHSEKRIYRIIPKIKEKAYYKASSAQKRMYMLQQFDTESIGYNITKGILINGKVSIARVEKTFCKLIQRHESLRTYFQTLEDEIIQKIDQDVEFKMKYTEKINANVDEVIKSFVKSFDLNKAPLFRVELIKVQEDQYILMVDMHHIISDGTSIGILINEFTKIYKDEELDDIFVQYKDYSEWQNNLIKLQEMKNQEDYWINRFSDEIPVLNLPTDFVRPKIKSFQGETLSFKLDKRTTNDLKEIVKKTGSTIYMVMLSVISILIAKYSGQEDVIVGSPIAGRNHIELENIIGMFVNTLPMRNRPKENKCYEEFLKEVKENALKAYENQEYQFEELVDKLNIRRDMSRNPLFDVMFAMQNMDFAEIELEDLKIVSCKNNDKVAKFDLSFTGIEIDEEILLKIEYCTKLFKRETIERIGDHFKNILKAVVKNTSIKLSEINMLSEEEENKLLYEFNDTYANYPRDKTIHELFEEQVVKTPDNIALVFEDKKLTYRELNEKSNSLARTLREKGVKQDSIVGIMAKRSLDMIVGIMGILKAGGAYLPIDPEYPEDRINYMLEDSKASVLLIQDKFINKIVFNGKIINLKDEKEYVNNIKNLGNINVTMDLAYVIYTSGSTGKPKGVMVEHKELNNFIQGITKEFDLMLYESILCITSIAFDIFVLETLAPLTKGLKIVMVKESEQIDGSSLSECIIKNQVKVMQATPSRLQLLMENSKFRNTVMSLKMMIIGGDSLNLSLLKRMQEYREIKIYNMYGPTETTVWSTIKELTNEEKITIGKPIQNTNIYILNSYMKLQAIGLIGEIYIGGEGLTRGYLNNLKLTSEKFIENPFNVKEKIYKTGDLARWLPDGNIEFIGRIDHQVKIRGFRIELGEIENQLLSYKKVKEAVVIDRQDKNGDKYLCAYIVVCEEISVSELREYLFKTLPEYMIPSHFMQLEKMPLNNNGKIDRKVLPEADGNIEIGTQYECARNEVEKTLIEIWSEILAVENIGINHNFFELGGHSLKATSLVSKIHKELNVEVPLKEIFKTPTIKGISEYIQSTEKNIYEEIKKVEEKEYYEVSSAQKRMYMLQQFDLQSRSYNMPGVLEVEGKLEIKRLENAFNKLIERHETLRTYFENIEGEIVQKISKDIDFKVGYVDISKTILEAASDKEMIILDTYKNEKVINEEIEKLISSFVKSFDLRKAPLLRVGVIKVEEAKHIIMFDMHHIISDGVSMRILTKEFTEIYEGKELEKIKVQYKDFSAWQNNLLKSEKMKKQKEYWLERFSDEIPVLNMPTDYVRPSVQSFEGDNIRFKLDKELTRGLNKIAKESGSTMYMVLLSGVNILLSKYSGQEDIVIGSTIAGRAHVDLEKIIGMFVNTLVMRNSPEGSKGYTEFLKEIKENALKAYENQEYQFEELVDKLNIRRDMSRNPLFDVMFTMQNMDSLELELESLKFIPYKSKKKIAKFDLTFSAVEIYGEILVDIEFCTKLFKKETVKTIVEHFRNILKAVVKNKSIKLNEIEMLSEEEKNKLLYEFNDTYADYPGDKTIHQLFEEQVEKTPDNLAIVFEDKRLTYRELNKKANRLARTLRKKGVKQDSIVAIVVERSVEMIVGIIAVLKAGGAYLPIDPAYPEDRISYMLEDSKVDIILTVKKYYKRLGFFGEKIDLEDNNIYSNDDENLKKVNSGKDLAYVIYTSGSTGEPKGVMIDHRSIAMTLQWRKNEYKLNYTNSILPLVSYVFDGFVTSFFTPIIAGSKVVILSDDETKDMFTIKEKIKLHHVSHLIAVPTMCNTIMEVVTFDDIKYLKTITVAGDDLKNKVIEKCKGIKADVEIINEYGPTENSVITTIMRDVKVENNIPIGKPKDNTQIYILSNGTLNPIGVVGEICISGEGLARGYLNNEKLTSEKFIENPFIHGKRMYRTGDLGRWLPDGNIEFIGRIDHQIKIRGFRIELGEIENQLLSYVKVKEAIVIDRQDKNGDKYLCAYIVSSEEISVGELREYLIKTLPEYMVPSYFIQLEKMPLTHNGKIDRKSLPEPDGNIATGMEYEGARNVIEEKLVNIWSEVLDIEKIGINDNFFELGGHSLKAIRLISLLHKNLNIKISLQDLFSAPTIKLLSKAISNIEVSHYRNILPLAKQDYYELSYAQKRLWIIYKSDPNSRAYNMPGYVTLYENVDKNIIGKIFSELIHRHEGLRTRFKVINGKTVQIIDDGSSFNLEIDDISKVESDKLIENRKEIYNELVSRVFDLEVGSLIYVKLLKIKDEEYDLIYCMHHIISDGFSMEILRNEFYMLYSAYKKEEKCILKSLNIQYKDFASWQNELIKNKESIQYAKSFWHKQLSGDIPILQLPFSYPNVNVISRESAGYRMVLSESQKDKLKLFEKEYNTSLFVVLVTSFNIFLAQLTNQNDILIGTAGFGRDHDDLKDIIGYFINTTILRNQIDTEESFIEVLKKVNENTLKALEYQNYPIELILDELNIRYPKISAFFNMLNMGNSNKEYIKGFAEYHIDKMQSVKFDLVWYITEYANGIQIICSYLLELFEPSRIEYIMGIYKKTLDIILENPNKKLKEYKLTENKRKFKKQ